MTAAARPKQAPLHREKQSDIMRTPSKAVNVVQTVARASKRRHVSSNAHAESSIILTPTDSPPSLTKTSKRRKVFRPSSPESLSPPYRAAIAYEPSLLPPVLSFSLSDAMSHLSAHDPRFRLMFRHLSCKPFQPPYIAIDPFKTLVTSIIGQQVSWMAARAINKRFRALFGFQDEDGFPGPAEVAKGEVDVLKSAGLSTRKAEYGE